MPFDSPQPRSQEPTANDSGFVQAVFEELQTAYNKDPFRFCKIYNRLKSDADYVLAPTEDRADSCKNLCLLDLAVANIKAESSDKQSAAVMFKDAEAYLGKLKSLSGGASAADSLTEIARQVKRKL